MNHIDVEELSELPAPAEGRRYLDFLGGDKQLRCFDVPAEMPRSLFMVNHGDLLDPCLQPIYQHKGITVRQDASFALPGFYILGFDKHHAALDDLDETTRMRAGMIMGDVRRGMRDKLHIPFVHEYCEEKPGPTAHVHFWALPFHSEDDKRQHSIYNMDIRAYAGRFKFSENRHRILGSNDRMRDYLDNRLLKERENAFIAGQMEKLRII